MPNTRLQIIAKLARKTGFSRTSFYRSTTTSNIIDGTRLSDNSTYLYLCDIQLWLRKDKGIHCEVLGGYYEDKGYLYIQNVHSYTYEVDTKVTSTSDLYPSYDEALEEALIYALNLIK